MGDDASCCFCAAAAANGAPRNVAVKRGSETRQVQVPRCSSCQRSHQYAMVSFIAIWIVAGWSVAAWVFFSWFESGVRPRGVGGLILASTVLASLPGLGIAVLAHRYLPRIWGAAPASVALARDATGRRLQAEGFKAVSR
jgi:hypothetical protein